jgi:hypothetical protein
MHAFEKVIAALRIVRERPEFDNDDITDLTAALRADGNVLITWRRPDSSQTYKCIVKMPLPPHDKT